MTQDLENKQQTLDLYGSSRPGIPITLITGWLGSGKTTLLNHILRNEKSLKAAIFVNEFGKVDVDGKFLSRRQVEDSTVTTLDDGCVCCTISQELLNSISDLLEKGQDINCIIIETSGVADVDPLLDTLSFTDLAFSTHVDAVVTVVDCETFDLNHYNSSAALSQIVCSDLVILSKTDLVTNETVQQVQSDITKLSRREIPCIRSVNGEVDLKLLLGIHRTHNLEQPLQTLDSKPKKNQHLHDDSLENMSYVRNKPFDIMKFENFVLNSSLLKTVIRSKGFLWLEGVPQLVVFHLVGKRTNPFETVNWRPTQTSIVFIGKSLDVQAIERELDLCLVSQTR